MPLIPGQLLNNRYRIVKLLGQGGFGAVYKAWDINLNGTVALKENFDISPAAQSQFAREASLLFNLRHPNLPRVSDHFSLPGQGQFLVMDYIEGEDLEEIYQKNGGSLPEGRVVAWVLQVLDALAYLHSRQPPVIHRDLKPANIKIMPDGSALLVDFGIAKVYDPNLKTTLGARAVTPGYSPPEQYGLGTTDARTDIYALGAVMYTVLTGQEPPESVQRSIGAALISPRSLNPSLSTETEHVILRAMELQPDQRYPSALDFKSALQTHAQPPSGLNQAKQPISYAPARPSLLAPTGQANFPAVRPSAGSPISSSQLRKPARPLTWALVGLALVLLVGIVITGGLFLAQLNKGQAIIQTERSLATHNKSSETKIPGNLTSSTPILSALPELAVTQTFMPTPTPTQTLPPTASKTPSVRVVLPWQSHKFTSKTTDYFQFQVSFTSGEAYKIWVNGVHTHIFLYDQKFNVLADGSSDTSYLYYQATITGTYIIRVYNESTPRLYGDSAEFDITVTTAN